MRWSWCVLMMCACGRVNFDPISDGGGTPRDSPAIGRTTTYLKASNTDPGDWFGLSLAIDDAGTLIAVGARLEASTASGIDGDQLNNFAPGAGAVYVFERTALGWSQTAYLKASNPGVNDLFGSSVAISGDGTTIVVGALGEDSGATGIDGAQADETEQGSGAAYVFRRAGATWVQEAYVKASNTGTNDVFGSSLALSRDGNTLAVGAKGEASDVNGINGAPNNNAAPAAGAVYVFTRSTAVWTQQAYIKASNSDNGDGFGTVALARDGNWLAVGAAEEASASTGLGGAENDNSAPGAGAVYLFARPAGTWTQALYVKGSNTESVDFFGTHVAFSADGTSLVVGAESEDGAFGTTGADNSVSRSGAAYVFTRSGNAWIEDGYLKAFNGDTVDQLGFQVVISGDGQTVGAAAVNEDSGAIGINGDALDDSAPDSGAVFAWTRKTDGWTANGYVKASNTSTLDAFGSSLVLSRDTNVLAVGAFSEDSAAVGVGGDQSNDAATDSGAVYVYE